MLIANRRYGIFSVLWDRNFEEFCEVEKVGEKCRNDEEEKSEQSKGSSLS